MTYNFLRLPIILTLLLFPAHYLHAQQWQLQKDENGIRVYLRELPDSDIKEFKGEIRIKAGLGSLLAVMDDTAACIDWVHNCAAPMMLKKISFTERYNFQISKMPIFVTDRGYFFHTVITQDANSKVITMQMAASPDFCKNKTTEACNAIKNYELIPVTRSTGFYRFTPETDGWTKVVWQQHTEPGGSLPGWLVNTLLLDIPFNTLDNLRRIVRIHKYKNARLVYGPDGIATGFADR